LYKDDVYYPYKSHPEQHKQCQSGCDKNVTIDFQWLQKALQPLLDFRSQHDVPIMVNQWGVYNTAVGHIEYMADMIRLLQSNRIHWTYWLWKGCMKNGSYYTGEGYEIALWNATQGAYELQQDKLKLLQKHLGGSDRRLPRP
jgi:hypothetical protein